MVEIIGWVCLAVHKSMYIFLIKVSYVLEAIFKWRSRNICFH